MRNYSMMILDKDTAGNASCSGVWFCMSGIIMHLFTMGKRDASHWVGICRNRHYICVPWDASDRWQKSSHPKDTASSNLKGGKCCVSDVVTAKLPYLTLPLRLVPFHQLFFCMRLCDARKAIVFFTPGLNKNESILSHLHN